MRTNIIEFPQPTRLTTLEQKIVDGLITVFFAEYPQYLDYFKPYIIPYFDEDEDNDVDGLELAAERVWNETELGDWMKYITVTAAYEDIYRNAMEMIVIRHAMDDVEKLNFLLDSADKM